MKRICLVISLLFLFPVAELAAKEKPTVFIIGDSSVKNGRGDGSTGLRGWGELIWRNWKSFI